MAEPQILASKQTALVRGATATKMGTVVLTSDRLSFFDQKFAPGAVGGALGAVLAEQLQGAHAAQGPMLEIPLASITGFRREKKLLNKGRIAVVAGPDEYLFNDGWDELSGALGTALTATGRQVTETAPEQVQVS